MSGGVLRLGLIEHNAPQLLKQRRQGLGRFSCVFFLQLEDVSKNELVKLLSILYGILYVLMAIGREYGVPEHVCHQILRVLEILVKQLERHLVMQLQQRSKRKQQNFAVL